MRCHYSHPVDHGDRQFLVFEKKKVLVAAIGENGITFILFSISMFIGKYMIL